MSLMGHKLEGASGSKLEGDSGSKLAGDSGSKLEGDSDSKLDGALLLVGGYMLSEILNCVSRSAHLKGTGNLKIWECKDDLM